MKAKIIRDVPESAPYDNLMQEVEIANKDVSRNQTKQRKAKKSAYPFTLRVHTWTRGDTDKLAETLGMKLTSDKKKFIYRNSSNTKLENCIYVEKRNNPFPKRTKHLERVESKLWTNTVEFSNNGGSPISPSRLPSRVLNNSRDLSER